MSATILAFSSPDAAPLRAGAPADLAFDLERAPPRGRRWFTNRAPMRGRAALLLALAIATPLALAFTAAQHGLSVLGRAFAPEHGVVHVVFSPGVARDEAIRRIHRAGGLAVFGQREKDAPWLGVRAVAPSKEFAEAVGAQGAWIIY